MIGIQMGTGASVQWKCITIILIVSFFFFLSGNIDMFRFDEAVAATLEWTPDEIRRKLPPFITTQSI